MQKPARSKGISVDETILGVSETNLGVSETILGISETNLGVSETILGVSETILGVGEKVLGREKTILGVGETFLGREKTVLGREKMIPPEEKTISATPNSQLSIVRFPFSIDKMGLFANYTFFGSISLDRRRRPGIHCLHSFFKRAFIISQAVGLYTFHFERHNLCRIFRLSALAEAELYLKPLRSFR